MKIFQTTRKVLKQLGMFQLKAFERHKIEIRFWASFFGMLTLIISTTICLIAEARTFQEYSDCFFGFSSALVCFSLSTEIWWNAFDMFTLIERFEAEIEKRMYIIKYFVTHECS